MTTEQARQTIKDMLGEVAPDADPDTLAADADLRDSLELDSLDFLNFVEELSKRSGGASTRTTTRSWPPWRAEQSSWPGRDPDARLP